MKRRSMPLAVRLGCLSLILVAGSVSDVWAQTASVRGFVTQAANGEPLPGANVAVENAAGFRFGAVTNTDGFYAVPGLAPGRYVVRASFVGYQTLVDTLLLAPREVRSLNITLDVTEEALDEVVVEAEQEGRAADVTAGLQTIQPFDIEQVPGPDLSNDFATYLTTLPGVVTIGDQGGRFFIRGGEPSQNLVLLDGMLIYQPFHILSFYSVFPADILNSVDLYAGGFGARFGGRLSSVIDVTTRNGNNRVVAGAATLSPFIVGGRLEGPLDEAGKVTFIASGRQSLIEEGATHLIDQPVPFVFNDFFVKLHGGVIRNSQISLTALRTYDRGIVGEDTGSGLPDEVRWRNEAYGARYLFLPGSLPVLAELMVSYSRFENELGPSQEPLRFSSTSRVNSQANITHYASFADVKWGLFARTLKLSSELGGLYQDLQVEDEFVTEAGLYLEPEFKPNAQWRIAPSLRIHTFPSKRRTFLEPRFRAVWDRGTHQVSAALGWYHQEIVGINDRRDATSVFTAWAAVPTGKVPRAFHAIVGYRNRLGPGLEVVVEGYYKRLSNLLIAAWTSFPQLTTRMQQADGRVAGLDLRLELRKRNFYGYINYGLSSVEYTADQAFVKLWFGTETLRFRPAHDRRHQVNMLASTRLLGFDLSARWQFGSGLPFNRALGFDGYLLMDGSVNVFEDKGNRRVIYERPFNGILPTYHRLDVSVERTFTLGRAGATVQASLINAYDRTNIFYLDIFTLRRADQLPLIPSFGLKIEMN
ncbi:MAG: carboxypeptidase regulatory-like domain-containing protein [Rhodothermales bacterium]